MLTKGPLVTFYGGPELLEEVSEDPPGWSLTILLVSSLAFHIGLFILKWTFSRKIQNYALNLKATLVNGILNIYGLLIILLISLITCFYAIYHYLIIKHFQQPSKAVMPAGLLLIYLITFLVVLLPFIQNFALRSFIHTMFLC